VGKLTKTEWAKLRDGFATQSLLDAVDELDTLRGLLGDDGAKPPVLRNQLLRLHQLAMAVINTGAEGQVEALFELAGELEDEVFDTLEAVTRLHETLSTLTALQPKDID
jgi:hypothetical protein